jgi:predicted nuclease of predicted toxin-antitoxin system
MKVLVDNYLSYRTASFLDKTFKGSSHVEKFGLDENTEDSEIWQFALEEGYSILTKDNDFESMSRLFGCPPKVIYLTCGNKTTGEIVTILHKSLLIIQSFIEDNENCLLYLQ